MMESCGIQILFSVSHDDSCQASRLLSEAVRCFVASLFVCLFIHITAWRVFIFYTVIHSISETIMVWRLLCHELLTILGLQYFVDVLLV